MSKVKEASQPADLQQLLGKFIELANSMKEEGKSVEAINAALILASCTYATYTAAGNEGYLKEDGVKKISEVYRQNLTSLQTAKKNQFNPQGKD
jgi:hypothetical protein